MNNAQQNIYNWPNLVSVIRILMTPILIMLAINQQPQWFIIALIFTVFTDVLDGFLARTLKQITEIGSRLDSWGDFIVYSTMALSAWLLWPEIVVREKLYFIIVLASFTLPVLLGIIKFKTLTSYHTWSVKLAVGLTIIGYILLFSELLDWPFKLAAAASLVAAIEEISITFVLKHPHVDVRTIWQAIKLNKTDNK